MAQQPNPLDALRKEIDAIDDSLHELLVRRAALAREIAKTKAAPFSRVPAMRPAREADILRRLTKKGGLSASLTGAIWREIISASLQSQTPFHLHVSSGAAAWLARDHFGAATPVRTHETAMEAAEACAGEPDSFAIVPVPEENNETPWWTILSAPGQAGPRVVAKIPFVSTVPRRAQAYVVGGVTHEASGQDTTCLLLETTAADRAALVTMLESAFKGIVLAQVDGKAFAEVPGFVNANDARLKALEDISQGVIARAIPVGGFANPIVERAP